MPQHHRRADHGRRRGHIRHSAGHQRRQPWRPASRRIASRRVPIYVIALAPAASATWRSCRPSPTNSGGQYFEVEPGRNRQRRPRPGCPCRRSSARIDTAVQHGMANPSDVNTAPTASLPYRPAERVPGHQPDHRLGEPDRARRTLNGSTLPDTESPTRSAAPKIPQRANVMVTTGFALPGFDMKMRAFRVYKPATDTTKADRLQVRQRRHRALDGEDADGRTTATTPRASCRNIFTALPNGSIDRRSPTANASTLSPYLNTWDADGPDRLRADAAARRDHQLDAGVHGSAVAGSAARLRLPGLRGRPRRPPDADLHWRQRRHDARASTGAPASRSGRTSRSTCCRSCARCATASGIDGYAYFVDGVGQGRRRQDRRRRGARW